MGMWQSEKNARKYKIGRQYAITKQRVTTAILFG